MVDFFGRNRFERIVNSAILLLLTFILLYMVYPQTWWPLEMISDVKVEIISKDVHPGENLKYKVSFTKKTDRKAQIHRTIINDRIFEYSSVPSTLPKSTDSVEVELRLPITATPNHPHILHWVACYELPMRNLCYRYESPPFNVVEGIKNANDKMR